MREAEDDAVYWLKKN